MAADTQAAVVELRIPCLPEFVGVARLAILGVASRMPLSYDEVEDVRLAVGEACTTAVERASKAGKKNASIAIRSTIEDKTLTIEVEDQVAPTAEPQAVPESPDELDEAGLGALLMELLVDEIKVEQTAEGGTLVTMVKHAG